jgi:hypothetical protein
MSKAIRSAAFPTAYLRMDGSPVSGPVSDGGGTVNCQSSVGAFETFEERAQPDGTVAFASVAFPDVHLRMDGRGVESANAAGGGTVNCAYGVGPWEKFHERPQPDGAVAFESAAFPGVYLRMAAGDTDAFAPSGHGEVNCQFGVGPWEEFHVVDVVVEPGPTDRDGATFRGSDYESDNAASADPNYVYTVDGSTVGGAQETYDYVATSGAGSTGGLGPGGLVATDLPEDDDRPPPS